MTARDYEHSEEELSPYEWDLLTRGTIAEPLSFEEIVCEGCHYEGKICANLSDISTMNCMEILGHRD